jgi:hypothetical protein
MESPPGSGGRPGRFGSPPGRPPGRAPVGNMPWGSRKLGCREKAWWWWTMAAASWASVGVEGRGEVCNTSKQIL